MKTKPSVKKEPSSKNGCVIELTREEILERIERSAQKRRRLSATELLQQYREKALEDPGEMADALALADLLPVDDPVFGRAAEPT